MTRFIVVLFSITLLFPLAGHSQAKYLQAGPMAGYSEMREVLLWVQTNAPAKVKFLYYEAGKPELKFSTAEALTRKEDVFTAKVVVENLEPGRQYQYELYINNQLVKRPYPLKFQTQKLWQWREDPPDFSFVAGSCAYVNETEYDRPGEPYGGEYEIFTAIQQQQPDFMLWLGDNVYLREADWYSRSGILDRYTHTRSLPELQPLWGFMHHYAIWDDHDYGPNDSDRNFRNKEQTLEAFRLFWGNPTFGIDGVHGITTMFQWADVEFFLLDNRFHRDPNDRVSGERTVLNRVQIDWLIDALSASRAPFKFVVMGGQFLNPFPYGENYSSYPEERSAILTLISQENISGVIFLTGDRHHTELSKLERKPQYPLYDLTISPLTAGPNTRSANEANFLRISETYVNQRNFARLTVSGPRKERVLHITNYDKTGRELWNYTIKANDLK